MDDTLGTRIFQPEKNLGFFSGLKIPIPRDGYLNQLEGLVVNV